LKWQDFSSKTILPKSAASFSYGVFLITRKVLDARRRGATTEAYGAIRRKEERSKATPPFGFAQGREPVEWPFGFSQGRESFDLAQDRELVERPVEWQMMP
jgi:hypothetical protein